MTKIEMIYQFFDNVEKDDRSIRNALQEFCAKNELQYNNGETRYAIWDKSWNFVLKVPRYSYVEHDYCALEVEHYKSAIEYGVARICLPIEPIYTSHTGIVIYKQTRYNFDCRKAYCNGYNEYLERKNIPNSSRGIRQKVQDTCYDGGRINDEWLARVIQLYGKKFVKSMVKWIAVNSINDLHGCNTGYLNNKPIILDYAGYQE